MPEGHRAERLWERRERVELGEPQGRGECKCKLTRSFLGIGCPGHQLLSELIDKLGDVIQELPLLSSKQTPLPLHHIVDVHGGICKGLFLCSQTATKGASVSYYPLPSTILAGLPRTLPCPPLYSKPPAIPCAIPFNIPQSDFILPFPLGSSFCRSLPCFSQKISLAILRLLLFSSLATPVTYSFKSRDDTSTPWPLSIPTRPHRSSATPLPFTPPPQLPFVLLNLSC